MATRQRDGVTLFYEEAGQGDPPMVFVHGWTCDHTYFAPQVDHFKTSHRTVGVDLRGHGASDAPAQDYTMSGFADDLAWLCGELGIGGAVVVGHSMGGAIAVELAARHPEVAAAIVLVDPAPIVVSPELKDVLGQLVTDLAGPAANDVRRGFVENMLFLPTDDPAVKARVLSEMMATPEHVALSCFEGMGAWDGETALKSVKVPVLNISAHQPPNDPAALAALCPALVNERTEGFGHFNQLLAPDLVNEMIERFVKSVSPTPSAG